MSQRIRQSIDGFLIALQFFSIVPIRTAFSLDAARLRRSIQLLPFVGLLFGGLIVFSLYLLDPFPLSTLFLSLLVISISIALSGGLHIDGWMDMSDAYFSYRSIERRHEILQDSRVGAFAVLSLIFLLAWRFVFVYETLVHFKPTTLFFLLFIPFLARVSMGLLLIFCKLAKEKGLAATFKSNLRKRDCGVYVIYFTLFIFYLYFYEASMLPYFFGLSLFTLLLTYVFGRFFNKNFGGITGDLLGASAEGVENGLWLLTWLLHLFVMA